MPRTAVVTGAARGLGEANARRLHADGDRVVLADLDLAGVEELAAELGSDAGAVEHDVRSPESWERLVAGRGQIDVLVDNAARTEFSSFWEIDVDEWDDVLATNLRGTYLGCRVVGARMRDRAPAGSSTSPRWRGSAGPLRRASTTRPRRRRSSPDATRGDGARRPWGDGERRGAGGERRADGLARPPEKVEAMVKTIRSGAWDAGRRWRRGRLPRLGRGRVRHGRDARRQRRDADAVKTRAALMSSLGASTCTR